MTRVPTIDELLDKNPHIDRTEVEESIQLLKERRHGKGKATGYNLASPLIRRPIVIGDNDENDSRTICLRRARFH